MSFTGNEEHTITLAVASGMTKNYRDAAGSNATLAHYFGKKEVLELLDQEDCVGMRIYYGLDVDGKKQLIIVGVNSSENDLSNGMLLDRSATCPEHCSSANPLNTTPTSMMP